MTALFLSPHLDDVAFSSGGMLAGLRRRGWRVVLATVFTASVARPSGFALACQTDKGLAPEVDYMALRRGEDAACARIVGVGAEDLVWLGLPEAPHRGYASARELFDDPRPDDTIAGAVALAIARLVDTLGPDLVLAPQAVGGHVDHRQVVRAVLEIPRLQDRLAWYRDLPYAEKFPEAPADPALPTGMIEVALGLEPADLEAKLLACGAYTTQVPFQFGDETAMRRRLTQFAAGEAARSGRTGHAETVRSAASVARLLGALSLDPKRAR